MRSNFQTLFILGVMEPIALRLVYGSTLSENRILTFLCPPNVAVLWEDTLKELISSIKSEDPRMVWLKDQYLFLYYQDDLCMGPLAADAIKVNNVYSTTTTLLVVSYTIYT